MTDKDKLEKLKKLADAMYYAAQYLTTDASRLHKAMDEYHKFIINEYHKEEPTIPDIVDEHFHEMLGEEPVSEDLEKASKEWLAPQLDKSYANYGEVKMMELTHFDGYAMLDAIEFGAQWQKTKDESTTEDLDEYINELSKQFPEVSFAKLLRIAVRVAKWQKENLWKPADGDDLPEIDMEVIAILDNGKVVFAHRPDPKGWDAKSIITEKVEHYTPETYGKGGWNIPDVKWWLDVDKLPNVED